MSAAAWVARCRTRLLAAVQRDVEPQVLTWDRAWDIIAPHDDALHAELERVEGGRGTRERAIALGVEYLAAWKRAAEEWRARTRPVGSDALR